MVNILKNVFSRGELTPEAFGRVDSDWYAGGVELAENMIVSPYGGIFRRSGTRYVGAAKYNGREAVLIPHTFSSDSDQAYIVEFGDLYCRFWAEEGQVLSGASAYEIVSVYSEGQVTTLQTAQMGDTMYTAYGGIAPRKLVRSGHTSWAQSTVTFIDGPFLPINDDGTNKVSSPDALVEDTVVDLTWTAETNINGGTGFNAADDGRLLRIKGSSYWVYLQITSVTHSKRVLARVKRVGDGNNNATSGGSLTTATRSWRVGVFDGGYWPRSVAFSQGRLAWAGADNTPGGIGFSRSNLPEDYSPSDLNGTVAADHGMFVEIRAPKLDRILWMVDDFRLLIGTAGAIRAVGAADTSLAMSATNITQQLGVSFGSAAVQPAQVGNSTVFAQRYGAGLRDLYYSAESRGMRAPAISNRSSHRFDESPIVKIVYQESPHSIIWALREDGRLIGCTFDKEEQLIGFHFHDIGGDIEDIAIRPGAERDELWMLVNRTIGGTKRYIEVLDQTFTKETEVADAFFVDSGLTYDGAAVSTLTGLGHLEGETVAIHGDGTYRGTAVVTAGAVAVPGAAVTKAHAGLPMVSEMIMLRPAIQSDKLGDQIGTPLKANHLYANVLCSSGIQVGVPGDANMEYMIRTDGTDTVQSAPTALMTGTYRVNLDDASDAVDEDDTGGRVRFLMATTYPAHIRWVNPSYDHEG